MDSLHSPSIPSSIANPPTTTSSSSKPSLQSLITQKEALEAELSALSSVLQSQGATMQTSLTTFDGFPRADIDVAQIRTVRARIVRLKNDWKSVMEKVEVAVLEGFAAKGLGEEEETGTVVTALGSVGGQGHSNGVGTMRAEGSGERAAAPPIEPPFARVNSVVEGSPAATAGLRAEDRVVKFGNADWQNHERLGKVAREVQTNEGREVVVKVIREGRVVELKLVPRRDWGGRGLLGCHLVPL
ncbi:putative 26S proteasome regulatory subunit [Oleoguttula sp. CCFEE 5521]